MENPATWSRTERIINDTFFEWQIAQAEGRFGQSLAKTIAEALREEGLLNETTPESETTE